MGYTRVVLSACVFSLLLVAGQVSAQVEEIKHVGPAATQATTRPVGAEVAAGAASVIVDPATGDLLSIRLQGKAEMAVPHPAGSEVPFGYLEVVDLRDHRTYSPLTAKSTLSDWKVTGSGDAAEVSFVQQYEGSPFRILQTLKPTPAGVRWEATVRLLEGQKDNRSVQVNFCLPLPTLWRFWGPVGEGSTETDGVLPLRFIYGHGVSGPMATVLPLVGVWGKTAGAAFFSPPDIQKCQISFDVHTQGVLDAATGVFRHVEDLQTLQAEHHMIGLRPGKDLKLAVCIAGTRPDYRAVYGHYVTSFPELFEPVAAARKYEGMYGITTPAAWLGQEFRRSTTATAPSTRRAGSRPAPVRNKAGMIANQVTCLEMHGHFMEYSRYITPEQMANPDMPIVGGENPRGNLTVNINRAVFDDVIKSGIAPFIYFYNVHTLPKNSESLFPQDVMVDELGEKEKQWYTECGHVAQPDTAFGQNLLEQLDLLLKAYPEVPAFFLDNYSIEKVDFAHDDGVTMVHNRPGYDLARNHQVIGVECMARLHKAGKVTMVNKLSTIESARGADMVLVEGGDSQHMIMHAMACPMRAVFPLGWTDPDMDRARAQEQHLQTLLLWGGTPNTDLARDAATMKAYRPLTDAMIGKRWVFDADPLTLPPGYQGQIFRIDPAAAHGGDVVVSLADTKRSWKDEKLTEGVVVTVRLPEAGQYKQATWLGAEKSSQAPQAVEMTTEGEKITLKLPPTGAAGILRLSK